MALPVDGINAELMMYFGIPFLFAGIIAGYALKKGLKTETAFILVFILVSMLLAAQSYENILEALRRVEMGLIMSRLLELFLSVTLSALLATIVFVAGTTVGLKVAPKGRGWGR